MKSLFRTFITASVIIASTAFAVIGQTTAPNAEAPVERSANQQQSVVKNNYNNQSPALIQFNEQTGAFSGRQLSGAKPQQDPTKRAALLMLAHEFETRDAEQEVLKQRSIARGNLVAREVTGDVVSELKGFSATGAPLYYITSNLGAAATISTDRVWPGGLAGLNLSGTGMIIGEWDENAIRTSHREFGGRATVMDGDSVTSNHATHVAGTIIGAGVDPLAKGMAYTASLQGYNWTNDEAEMATAAANGMLVSNHSYGLISGWQFGDWANTGTDEWYWFGSSAETEDRGYGRYSSQAQEWDMIAQNAPNYTIVKAAGNDRGAGPAAGTSHRVWDGSNWVLSTMTRDVVGGSDGFDCISHAGVAKNIITVGAVENISGGYVAPIQVVASSFHGWGPTDDGRIKPDIVAKGVGLYSSTHASNSSYGPGSGTSMASPTVTGSIALLQQHYMQTYSGSPMSAAMVKALVIQTADESGPAPGPDYMFGWGLMNTAKAAEVISNTASTHLMAQETLANGASYTYTFTTDGNSPIKASISWTDIAGAIGPNALNDTTRALVNDLDIRITRLSDNTLYQPWVLDPANPANQASTGDNDRDNVEQVFLANPIAGDYMVTVTHKGTLAVPQAFAMVLSGVVGANSGPQVFWINDFGTSTDWSMGNASGNIDNWTIGTVGPAGGFAIPAISSPSSANGFGLFDSDVLCSGNQNAYLTIANPINVSGYSDVKLRFYQQYRKYYDSTLVEVSTDGQQWATFLVNGALVNNSFSNGNPEFVQVDISSVADNQAQVWVRFRFWSTSTTHTANGGCGYAWMVDDVSLQGTPVTASTTNVTFQVNMINETVSPLGVRIAGNFQGWDPSATLMVQSSTEPNIYTYTTAIQAGTLAEYKFVNGDDWSVAEGTIPAACNVNNNRGLVVPAQDTVLGRVAFGSCSDASTLVFVPVTFNVDMSNETIRPEGVHIAGSFQGWLPSSSPMTAHPSLSGVYTYTAQIPEGTDVEYKFVNGNDWGVVDSAGNFIDWSESVPAACAGITGPNRYFTVPTGGIDLPTYVFGSCNTTLTAATVPIGSKRDVDTSGVNLYLGDTTSFLGVVVSQNLRASGLQLTIMDATGGIQLFRGSGNFGFVPALGDSLYVMGVMGQFNGNTQLNLLDMQLLGNGQLPAPMVVGQLDEMTENNLVRLNNVSIVSGSWPTGTSAANLTATDGNSTFTIRVSPNGTDLAGLTPPAVFDIIGVGGQFDNSSPFTSGYQIFPRQASDVMPASVSSAVLDVDFANGIPADWTQEGFSTIGGTLTPDTNARFEYRGPNTTPSNAVGSRGAFNGVRDPIQSPTASNGFVIFDSDYLDNGGVAGAFGQGPAPASHKASLISPVMDLSNVMQPRLRFNQTYRRFTSLTGYTGATVLLFSRDGGITWPDTIPLNLNVGQNASNPSNDVVDLMLNSVLGGESNARMAFLFYGDYYYWMIDDIKLEQAPPVDVVLSAPRILAPNDVNYGSIPVDQEQGMRFSATLSNFGADPVNATGVVVNVLNQGNVIWTEGSPLGGTLPSAGDVQVDVFSPTFTAGQVGEYQVEFAAFANPNDADPTSDVKSMSFAVTDTVYALDRASGFYTALGSGSFPSLGSFDGMRMAALYAVGPNGLTASSATIFLASSSTPGTQMEFQLYNAMDLSVAVAFSAPYTVTQQDIQNGFVTLSFPSGTVLAQGDYYLAVEFYTNGGASVFNVLDDISVPQPSFASNIFLPANGLWYTNGNAFMIRLNSAPNVQPPVGAPVFVAAPQNNGATTGIRGPNGSAQHAFMRGAAIVRADEFAAAGVANGRTIRAFGMSFSQAPSEMVSGNIKIYLLPTADVTYAKGTAWTSIVNDMDVVFDGLLTLMPGTQNWTVELDQAFLYNGDNYYVAYDWSSTGPYAITPATYFANSSIPSSGVSANSDTAAPQTLNGTAFRVEMLWGMQRFANDLEVVSLFAKGKNPRFIGGDEQVMALIRNNGYNFMAGNVNLMASGANGTFQSTFVALDPDSSMLVTFPPASLTNLGYSSLQVNVDVDDNTGNNFQYWQQEITDSIFAYNDTMPASAAVGFNTGSGMMVVKHRINSPTNLRALRIQIANNPASVGNVVDGVVTDVNGNILATTSPVTIDTSHLGQWVVMSMPTAVALQAGEAYLFGLRQTENLTLGYFPMAYQAESPTRPDAYFTAPYVGGMPNPVAGFRLMVEAHMDPVETVDVTFRVNMSKYPVSPIGVHLAGNFQGWVSDATPMTFVGNDIWERVVSLPAGYAVEYKFINGNTWDRDETNWMADCGVENGFGSYNRAFTVPAQDTVMPTYFLNSCGTNLNELSLADLQYVPDYILYDFDGTGQPDRRSRYVGEVVTIEGRVAGSAGNSALSASFKNGYLQMDFPASFGGTVFPAWMGVNVRLLDLADTSLFVAGNQVQVTGVVAEFPGTNPGHSETQLDVSSGGVSVQTGNSSPNVLMADLWMFNDMVNGSLQQNAFGERFEGSYVRMENLTVAAVTEFLPGRFDLILVDGNGLQISTRDVSRVMRAPYFSNIDSNAALYVQVGDQVNIQGFISEVIFGGVPQYRIAPWEVSDIEVNPSTSACPTQIFAYSNTDLCLDQAVQLEVSANGTVNYVEWFVNGALIPNANGMMSIFAVSAGDYEAVVYYQDGCIANTNTINVTITVPHQAFVAVNGPLHHEMGQSINTTLSAVPQQLLRVVAPAQGIDQQIAYRAMGAQNGWVNVPQGTAANFNGSLVIARDGGPSDSLLCGAPVNAAALSGNVAVIYRGACAISDKVMNAQNAGAIAVIVVNNIRNQTIPVFTTNPLNGDSVTVPVLIVSAEAGDFLQQAIEASATSNVSVIFEPSATAAYSYQWLKDNNPIPGANGSSYVVTSTGDYQLEAYTGAVNNCVWRSGYFPVSQSTFQQTPWVLQNLNQPDENLTIRNIAPVSDQVAWAVIARGMTLPFNVSVFRTVNGGSNWSELLIPNTFDLGTSDITAVDANTAFVTLFGDSSRQGVYKTTDAGLSWTRLNVHNTGGFPNFTYFWNANEGVTGGDPVNGMWEVYTTSDGGVSWLLSTNIVTPSPNEAGLTAEYAVTADGSLYFPTDQGQIIWTSNKGQSWNTIQQPTLGQTQIAWGEQGLGVIYNLSSASLLVTEDGGFTWDPMERPYGGLGTILDITFVPGVTGNQILFATGTNGSAYGEEGVGWFNIDGIYHGPVRFISPTVGWSGGISSANGQAGIWKWDSNVFGQTITDGSISGVVRYSNAAQTPMNNSTVGLYDLQSGNLVGTEITDAAGTYSFPAVPAGDYELRVTTSKGWGGVNATDALRVARHFTGLQPLMGIRQVAADVNRNTVINSTDALQIAQRFTGLLNNPNNLRIYFDAMMGGNLATTGSVHFHSGAILDQSQNWQYVVGDWGNPSATGQMTAMGNGMFSIAMNPMAYYSMAPNGPIPSGSVIQSIGMVFRNSGPCGGFGGSTDPCLEQKDGNGQDIFLNTTVNPPLSSYLGVDATQSQVNGFVAGDWLFETATVNVQGGQNTVANMLAICVGDVDGSFNPSNARVAPLIALDNAGEPEMLGGKLVRLPIRIEQGAQLGAMSLVMNYDPKQMQPVSLKLVDPARQAQALVNITDTRISLGWYDLAGWVVTNEEVIMELEALVYGDVTNLALSIEGGSEFADVNAEPIETTVLLLPGVKAPIQTAVGSVLSLNNYPNPFKTETNIAFNLPEAADVKIRITDARGRQVALLNVGELTAGAHNQHLDAAALEAGVYFCELHAAGSTRSEKAIIRLIVQ